MYTWHTFDPVARRAEMVEVTETLDELLATMAELFWEETSGRLAEFVTDGEGRVVATALFGPDLALLIALGDGRLLRHERPYLYGGKP